MNTEILEQLNESQRVAVEYCDGASLVIAGAGSGKTRVRRERNQGVNRSGRGIYWR